MRGARRAACRPPVLPSARSTPTGMTSSSRFVPLALAAGVLVSGGTSVTGDSAASGSAFVGSARCATCHGGIHRTWTAGRHSRMLQPATAD